MFVPSSFPSLGNEDGTCPKDVLTRHYGGLYIPDLTASKNSLSESLSKDKKQEFIYQEHN